MLAADLDTAVRTETNKTESESGMEELPIPGSSALKAARILKRINWPKAWIWLRYGRFCGLRVRVGKRRVSPTTQKGFMGAEVEVSVRNVTKRPIEVRDVRLMLSSVYGGLVESSVPGETSDPGFPATLGPGTERCWYVRGEQVSKLLTFLFHPPAVKTAYDAPTVPLYARCSTSTGRIAMSHTFEFPTDVNAHWP